jgi:hypothetical protein
MAVVGGECSVLTELCVFQSGKSDSRVRCKLLQACAGCDAVWRGESAEVSTLAHLKGRFSFRLRDAKGPGVPTSAVGWLFSDRVLARGSWGGCIVRSVVRGSGVPALGRLAFWTWLWRLSLSDGRGSALCRRFVSAVASGWLCWTWSMQMVTYSRD